MDVKSRIRFVYAAPSAQALAERYDTWAPDYDQDVDEMCGYLGPQKGAEMLAAHVPATARILDAGAGTGLVGLALRRLGYRNLVGVDNSHGMLSQAKQKRAYRALHHSDLAALEFASASFDAVISIGVFTYGHAPAHCLQELIRVVKPNGLILVSMRPDFFASAEVQEKIGSLAAGGHWTLVESGEPFVCFPKDNCNDLLRLWAFKVGRPSRERFSQKPERKND